MGLLNFLASRNKSTDRLSQTSSATNPSVRGQAYDATAPSQPPVQGTYPMAGNGPTDTLETLQRSQPRHNRSDSNHSHALRDDNASEVSAPGPIVPRFRELAASVERPKTAPNGGGLSGFHLPRQPTRSRRQSMKAPPPVPPHVPRPGSVSSTSRSLAEARQSASPSLHNSYYPPLPPPPRIPGTYSRSNSIQSVGSARGFVDLLDAQSEFKPSNFRIRVQAAGARDYGEDVADRNIGENGADTASAQAQAFYALTGNDPLAESESTPTQPAAVAEGDRSFKPPARYDSLDLAARVSRTPYMNPLAQHPISESFAETETHRDGKQAGLNRHMSLKGRGGRRQSLSSYVPSSTSAQPSSHETLRPKSMHRPSRRNNHLTLKDAETRARSTAIEKGLGIYSHLIPKSEPEPPPSPSFARDSVILARKNYSLPTTSKTPESPYRGRASSSRTISRNTSVNSQISTRRQPPDAEASEDSAPNAGDANHFQPPLQRRNRRSSLRMEARSDAPGQAVQTGPDLHMPEDGSAASPPRMLLESLPHGEELVTLTRDLEIRRNRDPRHPSRKGDSNRAKSVGSASHLARNRLDEIIDQIPAPAGLNHWAMSSTTPTASASSTASSTNFNFSGRSRQSRHTPDTSVDMGMADDVIPGLAKSIEQEPTGLSHPDAAHLASPTCEAFNVHHNTTFNIDDYLSTSDDEEFEDAMQGPYRPRGEKEEHLLFKDSGEGGLQLPGLYDSLPHVGSADKELDDETEHHGSEGEAMRGRARHSQNGSATAAKQPQFLCEDDDMTLAPSMHTTHAPGYGSDFESEGEHHHHAYEQLRQQREAPHRELHRHEGHNYDVPHKAHVTGKFNHRGPPPVSYTRADLAPGKKGMKRISALGTLHQSFEMPREEWNNGPEEDDQKSVMSARSERSDKVDIRAAVKLRKEVKAKQRARGAVGVRRSLAPGRTSSPNKRRSTVGLARGNDSDETESKEARGTGADRGGIARGDAQYEPQGLGDGDEGHVADVSA